MLLTYRTRKVVGNGNVSFLARPLLAFKRDLSRPTSEARLPAEDEPVASYRTRQESNSSSSPLEIIDIDSTGAFKSIFDKVKNTLSPSSKRRDLDSSALRDNSEEDPSSPRDRAFDDQSRKHRADSQRNTSVGGTSDSDSDNDTGRFSNDQHEIIRNAHSIADQILSAGIDKATGRTASNNAVPSSNSADDDFQRDFHRAIQTRHVSADETEESIYQDLSAEIVTYVLEHALRTIKQEQEQPIGSSKMQSIAGNYEQNEDFVDLK